jgi:hypothetical protein
MPMPNNLNFGTYGQQNVTPAGSFGDPLSMANYGQGFDLYGAPKVPNYQSQYNLYNGATQATPKTFMESMLGTTEAPGWGGMALGAASGIGNLYMGMQQYGLAKASLAQNKQQFDTNFAAQKGLTNANLEDRQRARVASNSGAYQSVGDYMSKNEVK